MHAVTGAYADPIFVEKLGADPVVYQLLEMNHFFFLEEFHYLMLNIHLVCRTIY